DRADLQLDPARVMEGLGERYLIPTEPRLAHIDGDVVDALYVSLQHAAARLEPEITATGLLRHRPRNAAGTIPARARGRTVGIVDAYKCVGAGRPRIVEHHELIEMSARVGGDGTRLFLREDPCASSQIDHHDLVSEAVHLLEGDGIAAGHGPI